MYCQKTQSGSELAETKRRNGSVVCNTEHCDLSYCEMQKCQKVCVKWCDLASSCRANVTSVTCHCFEQWNFMMQICCRAQNVSCNLHSELEGFSLVHKAICFIKLSVSSFQIWKTVRAGKNVKKCVLICVQVQVSPTCLILLFMEVI